MTPWLDDGDLQLYHGDVRSVLAGLPADSVQCVVTSPPYWGLRDYGTAEWTGGDPTCDHVEPRHPAAKDVGLNERLGRASGERHQETAKERQYRGRCERCGAVRVDSQLGLEESPDAFVTALVDVFRGVRRVLRDDGTAWLNLGDSYAAGGTGGAPSASSTLSRHGADGRSPYLDEMGESAARRVPHGLKPKDLVGVPWRVAFALQADGWYLRSAVVWDKPNPMPESVSDRPTSSYEMVFLLSKSARYFYDQEAVRERYEAVPQRRHTSMHDQPKAEARERAGVAQGDVQGGAHASPYDVQAETLGDLEPDGPRGPDGRRVTTRTTGPLSHDNYGELSHQDGRERWPNGGRNMRNVWRIPTQPTPEAHFATYPEELVRRCVAAGTSEAGECSACGKPWERIVEREAVGPPPGGVHRHHRDDVSRGTLSTAARHATETTGWQPTCACDAPAVPQCVLDPFIGSGTTALVARRLGRHAIGIDLNEAYLRIAANRTRQLSLLA